MEQKLKYKVVLLILGVLFFLLVIMNISKPIYNEKTLEFNDDIIRNPKDFSINLKTSAKGWTTTEVVSTESMNNSYAPSIAVDGTGNVHVAWHERTNYGESGPDNDIFYKRWNVISSTWTTTEVISTESMNNSYDSSIGVDDAGNVHVAWQDHTDYDGSGPDEDIFYKQWNADSSTWMMTEVVSTESITSTYDPSIVVDSAGNIHVAWVGWSETGYDIFYKQWNVKSSTWTNTEIISTESTYYSFNPSIAVDDARNVHVVWEDDTDYGGSGPDSDIFYKRLNAEEEEVIIAGYNILILIGIICMISAILVKKQLK